MRTPAPARPATVARPLQCPLLVRIRAARPASGRKLSSRHRSFAEPHREPTVRCQRRRAALRAYRGGPRAPRAAAQPCGRGRYARAQTRRGAGTDHLANELKEHLGNVAWGHRLDEVGGAGESELGDSLRASEPSDELAVRRCRDEEQDTPARSLLEWKGARAKNDRSSKQEKHLD